MDNLKVFFKKLWLNYNHLLILLYYAVIILLYSTFNLEIEPEYYVHSVLDDYIPFVKEFIIPYIYWYLYVGIAMAYFGLTSREDFIKMTVFIFSGMTICFFIYLLWPNGQKLRPIISDQDLFSRMILKIYLTDRPTNVCPSMHVLDSIAVHIAVMHSKHLSKVKWLRWTSLISAVLISLSTVMIKQHSILDVFYACILSYLLYLVIYRRELFSKVKLKGFFTNTIDRGLNTPGS